MFIVSLDKRQEYPPHEPGSQPGPVLGRNGLPIASSVEPRIAAAFPFDLHEPDFGVGYISCKEYFRIGNYRRSLWHRPVRVEQLQWFENYSGGTER